MKPLILAIRLSLFYFGYILSIIVMSLSGVVLSFFAGYKIRSSYMLLWNRFIVYWVKLIFKVKFEVVGKENLPNGPYVALSKHQSQWETYFLQYYLAPVCIVLKRELLKIPFFGWGLKLMDPIAIDRGSPKQALRQTLELGKAKLEDNISVLIFPEGSRMKPGTSGKYARGGANIAMAAGVPVVPIALNAGEFWPAGRYEKFPGTITVSIGKPVSSTEFTSLEITEQAKEWIENEIATMATNPLIR